MLERTKLIGSRIWDRSVNHGIVPVWTHSGRKTRVAAAAVVGAGVLELKTGKISDTVSWIGDRFDGGDGTTAVVPAVSPTPTLFADRNVTGDGRVAVRPFEDENADGVRNAGEHSISWSVNLATPKLDIIGVGSTGTNLRDLQNAVDGTYKACPDVVDGWAFTTTTTDGCQVQNLEAGEKIVFDIGVVREKESYRYVVPALSSDGVRAEITQTIPDAGNGLMSPGDGPDMGLFTVVGLSAFAASALMARIAGKRSRHGAK